MKCHLNRLMVIKSCANIPISKLVNTTSLSNQLFPIQYKFQRIYILIWLSNFMKVFLRKNYNTTFCFELFQAGQFKYIQQTVQNKHIRFMKKFSPQINACLGRFLTTTNHMFRPFLLIAAGTLIKARPYNVSYGYSLFR